jgi:hypothetical protein
MAGTRKKTRKKLQIAQTIGSCLCNPVSLSLAILIWGAASIFWPASGLALSIGAGSAMILCIIVAPIAALIYLVTLAMEVYNISKGKNISFYDCLSQLNKERLDWESEHLKQMGGRLFILLVGAFMSMGFSLGLLIAKVKHLSLLEPFGKLLFKALTYLSGLPHLGFLAPSMAVTHILALILFVHAPLVFAHGIQKIVGLCIPDKLSPNNNTQQDDLPLNVKEVHSENLDDSYTGKNTSNIFAHDLKQIKEESSFDGEDLEYKDLGYRDY